MASTYITKTPSSAGNLKTWTISLWVKFSTFNVTEYIVGGRENSSNRFYIRRSNTGALYCYSVLSGSSVLEWTGTSLLRDTSGWYNLVFRQDTTQGTGADRFRVYINGQQETLSFAHTPDQNEDLYYNKNQPTTYGSEYGSTQCFNGLMSHINFCDGQSYAATVFGSTDSSTGEWKINTSPSITMGTNGYTILKDGNTVTDSSTNSNDWAVGGGTLTKTEDCPSNVFPTWNPLNEINRSIIGNNVFSNGNTNLYSANNDNRFNGTSTLGMTSGKYYAEFKDTSGSYNLIGITSRATKGAKANRAVGYYDADYGLYAPDGKIKINNAYVTYGASYTTNDIISVAVDCDNNKIYFAKNGAWGNGSGAWGSTTWASNTGAYTIADVSTTEEGAYFFAIGDNTASVSLTSANFGNGYQGTTAVSSAGTNASGNGIFEYDVPTGFTALSTKGLNL